MDNLKNPVLISKILEMVNDATSALSMRVQQYREIDAMLKPKIEKDEKGRTVVNLPIAFSMFDAIRADLCGLLINEPVIRYDGVSPEDMVGVALLEKVISFQTKKNAVARALDVIISNSLKYNVCAGVVSWRRTLNTIGKIAHEGSYLIPLDPYRTLFDPSVPMHLPQDANYIGWIETLSISKLLELVKTGYFAQFPELRDVVNNPSSFYYDSLRQCKRNKVVDNKSLDIITMYINIIPSEFGLGNSIMPEKWLFCLLGNQTLIKAVPLGMEHNQFPVIVCSPDCDDFDYGASSRTGMMTGMQSLIDWLFETHIKSTTRALQNRIIVDPEAINLKDVLENDTFIRVRPSAMGRDLRTFVHQLNIQDVTTNYYGDINQTMAVMERISGVDAASTGQLRQGGPERLTSQEFLGTLAAAKGRLGRMAQLMADQIFPNLGMLMAYNTQKMMSKEVMIKITGRWEQELSLLYPKMSASVSVSQLNVNFDVTSYEGSRTSESSAEMWYKVLELMSTNQLLAQSFDITRVFTHLVQSMGIKDVESFLPKQPQQEQQMQGNPTQMGMMGNNQSVLMDNGQPQEESSMGEMTPDIQALMGESENG
jgi:hypothetical protein